MAAEERGIVHSDLLNKTIVDLVSRINTGRIMILVNRLDHGLNLSQMIPNAEWIHGNEDGFGILEIDI